MQTWASGSWEITVCDWYCCWTITNRKTLQKFWAFNFSFSFSACEFPNSGMNLQLIAIQLLPVVCMATIQPAHAMKTRGHPRELSGTCDLFPPQSSQNVIRIAGNIHPIILNNPRERRWVFLQLVQTQKFTTIFSTSQMEIALLFFCYKKSPFLVPYVSWQFILQPPSAYLSLYNYQWILIAHFFSTGSIRLLTAYFLRTRNASGKELVLWGLVTVSLVP